MNTLTRYENKWNPFKEMDDLHNRLTSLLTRGLARLPLEGEGREEPVTQTEWAPLVDISEDEKEYVIRAELPEVAKSDVKVSVEGGVLTIQGERKFEKEVKGRRYHRVERAYGSFARTFSLPDDADAQKVTADFKDGMLQVRVPKSEAARPRSIEINVA